MSDAVSFAEIDGQHVELLPARTVMSLYAGWDGGGRGFGFGGAGGQGQGGLGVNLLNIGGILGSQFNLAGNGTGGAGGPGVG